MGIAFLFPGQGPALAHSLSRLPDHPAVRACLQEARQTLGEALDTLDQPEALRCNGRVQQLMVLCGVCMARALEAETVRPAMVGGLSVGAFGAAVCCGTLALGDALDLVGWRGRWMAQASPAGFGMAVLAGWRLARVQALLAELPPALGPVWVANLNAHDQFALSGRQSGLRWLIDRSLAQGLRRAELLAVPLPSHCPVMAPVTQQLAQRLAGLSLRAPTRPYLSNAGGRALHDAEAIRHDLALSVSQPVLWSDATEVMVELGARLFIEMPPGHVLSRLAQASHPNLPSQPADGLDLASLCRLARAAQA